MTTAQAVVDMLLVAVAAGNLAAALWRREKELSLAWTYALFLTIVAIGK